MFNYLTLYCLKSFIFDIFYIFLYKTLIISVQNLLKIEFNKKKHKKIFKNFFEVKLNKSFVLKMYQI